MEGQLISFESGEVTLTRQIKRTSTEELYLSSDSSVVKIIPLHTSYSKEVYQNETTALRLLMDCPNIIELKDFSIIQSSPAIGLIKLEYCANSSLYQLAKNHCFNEAQVLQVAKALLMALSKLEQAGLVHKNISLKNILASQNFEFFLSGFGCSRLLQDLVGVDPNFICMNIEKTMHPDKRPPEVTEKKLVIEKIDVYSAGCVIFNLLFRRYPKGNEETSIRNLQVPMLSKLISACLQKDPNKRPTATSLLFEIQPLYDFSLVPTSEKIEFPSSSLVSSIYRTLNSSEKTPDLYFLQLITSKLWISPTKTSEFFQIINTTEKKLTIVSIKILLLLHRLMISGPSSILNSREIFENVLNLWTNKSKDANDQYFSDYHCGLIRQLSRVLIDKIMIHQKYGGDGGWRVFVSLEFIEDVLEYLSKVIKICEGLAIGISPLPDLMNFLKMQLVEESQRVISMTNSVLNSNHKSSEKLPNLVNRVNAIINTAAHVEENNSNKYLSNDHESPAEVPEFVPVFPQFLIPEKPNYLENRWKIKQDELLMEKVLASGSSCTVYKGKYKYTPVAIKIMKGTFMGRSLEKEFEREVTAMVTLRHPNLVLFMGACKSPQMIIVSEFCAGGSLFTLLHESKNIVISWRQKLKIIKDVARGMLYLHEAPSPILHRDLKSLNLLLIKPVNGPNDSIFIKITDFGVARILENNLELTGQMGTCHWMAPEVLSNQPYSLEADIYSYGIVVWEVIAREIPYNNTNPMTIPVRVIKGERPNLSQIPSTCPESLKNLVRACWDPSPAKRPKFNQIIDLLEAVENSFDS